MKLNFKNYQIAKTKDFLKQNTFILFSYSANQNSLNWLLTEQEMRKLNFKYHKIYNNTTVKMIKNSVFKNFLQIIHSQFFFLTAKQINNKILFNKYMLIKNFKDIQFNIHSLKLHNKIYSISELRKINSLEYLRSMKIFYQFIFTNLKKLSHFNLQKFNSFFETM